MPDDEVCRPDVDVGVGVRSQVSGVRKRPSATSQGGGPQRRRPDYQELGAKSAGLFPITDT